MKTAKACTGMLSSEIDDFKFLKTAKNTKSTCITCTIASGAHRTVLSFKTSPSLTRDMNVKLP